MVLYTWWCWHIYKGEVVGVDLDQLGEVGEEKSEFGLSEGRKTQPNLWPTRSLALRVAPPFPVAKKWAPPPLGRCPKTATTPFRISDITPSSELRFR